MAVGQKVFLGMSEPLNRVSCNMWTLVMRFLVGQWLSDPSVAGFKSTNYVASMARIEKIWMFLFARPTRVEQDAIFSFLFFLN